MQIRFDDIDALRARIGDSFGPWGAPIEVTQAMIDAFAELTGDHQWIHTDVARARAETAIGATIAHGFLLVSLLPALGSGLDFELRGMGSVINYGADRVRFVSPVPAASRVHARGRLIDVTAKSTGTLLATEREVAVVNAPRPALVYRGLTLLTP